MSQNSSPEAGELLFEIAKTDADPEQRGEAIFWLAQSDNDDSIAALTELLTR